jgi:hypothetical protein
MEPGTYQIVLVIDTMENTGSRNNKGEVFVRGLQNRHFG